MGNSKPSGRPDNQELLQLHLVTLHILLVMPLESQMLPAMLPEREADCKEHDNVLLCIIA